MAERQDNLLKAIVEEHVETAEPVGSGLIAEKYFPELSSATIRNEMAQLEADGLIFQPHTSAGRIPTPQGYQYYLEKLLSPDKLALSKQKDLDSLALSSERDDIKRLAKTLADLSSAAVLIGFSAGDVYYTGIANLFRQPEFAKLSLVYSLSDIIDHLDEVMGRIFHDVGNEPKVFVGEDNPFGNDSSAIVGRYQLSGQPGIIGILGPSRMDYKRNISLLRYSQKLINNLA